MKTKLILSLFLCTLILHTSSHASTYVSYRGGFDSFAGICAAALIGGVIGANIQNHKQERAIQFDSANKLYAYEMIRDYNPRYHYEYVSSVSRSCLPEHEKTALIGYFNERRLEYVSMQNGFIGNGQIVPHAYYPAY